LSLDWCKGPDIGLPKPDAVIYLNLTKEAAAGRSEYGEERYENMDFQDKVKHQFFKLKDESYWKVFCTYPWCSLIVVNFFNRAVSYM